jgi:hypothetical protein
MLVALNHTKAPYPRCRRAANASVGTPPSSLRRRTAVQRVGQGFRRRGHRRRTPTAAVAAISSR